MYGSQATGDRISCNNCHEKVLRTEAVPHCECVPRVRAYARVFEHEHPLSLCRRDQVLDLNPKPGP
jgi:hypothetical protein